MFIAIEKNRIKLQELLDKNKTKKERNKMGQFATPPTLALDMLTYAKTLISDIEKIKFLDPGINTGVFYSALLSIFKENEIISAKGYEIDPYYGEASKKLWENFNIDIHIQDFTLVEPKEKVNLIVANPPYVRHHHLTGEQKEFLQKKALKLTGISLSKLCGLYCYFLLLCDQWLDDNGVAGWLIPTEFMDVNYGNKIREYLLNNVTLLRVHRFNSDDTQFNDALVSSAIIWYKKAIPSKEHLVSFSYGGSLLSPKIIEQKKLSDLTLANKWNSINLAKIEQKNLKLSDFFSVKRGIATGANDYFILDEHKINNYQIPSKFLIPILPSPRFLSLNEIHCKEDGTPLINNKQFVFSSNEPENTLKEHYPNVYSFIEEGKKLQIPERYLCKNRPIWYQQETRESAPLLCTYMGRNTEKNPIRFILNHSNAIVTNGYLMLYPKPWLKQRLLEEPELLKLIWEKLNTLPPETFIQEGRVYGGGLHKIEPKELGNISLNLLEPLLYKTKMKLVVGQN